MRRAVVLGLVAVGVALLVAVVALLIVRSRLADERIKAALEAQASAALGEPVRIDTLDVHWWPRPGLTAGGVSVGAPPADLTIARVVLTTGLRPLLSGRVAEAEVTIERSGIDAPALLALLTRRPAAPASGTGSGLPLTIESVRAINLRDVQLRAGGVSVAVDGDLAYAGDRLEIERFEVRSDGSSLSATGAVDLATLDARLNIDADTLDLDRLLAFSSAAVPGGGRAAPASRRGTDGGDPAEALEVAAVITARQGRVVGAEFTGLSATARITPSRVLLGPLELTFFGGRLKATAEMRTGGETPQHRWTGTVSGVDLPQLVAFAGAPNAVTGSLASRFSISAAGVRPDAALGSATGSAHVAVTDGRVPGLDVVRTVVLLFGHPSGAPPEGSGEEFTSLTADVSLAQGTARTKNLLFKSRDFDMTGTGVVDLRRQTLDLDVSLVLSTELSKQAGKDLYRYAREGDRIILPADITGTVTDPAVMIDLDEALSRALENKLKEKAKSLLERIIR